MNRVCDKFEDLIWEHARTGDEPPEEARRHVESCRECSRVLEDAKALSGLLAEAGRVPDAPDCRAAVMARISGETRRRAVPAWAYACAVISMAGVVAAGIVSHRPRTPVSAPFAARNVGPEPSPAPALAKKIVPQPQQVVVDSTRDVTQPTEKIKSTSVRRHHRPQRRGVRPTETVAFDGTRSKPDVGPLAPGPRPPAPNTQLPTPNPRSVAAVYVTWPEAGDSGDTSYQYVERDAQTGERTQCSVKRSGNKVEVYIESTPGGNTPPVKGSIQNESTINA
jgi:hypothetical protein